MKRWLFFAAVLCFSVAHAQETYFGLGVSQILLTAPPQYGLATLLDLQVGGPTAPEFGSLELRASLSTILLFSNLGFDVLGSVRFPETSLRLYLGGGLDVLFFPTSRHTPPEYEGLGVFYGLHGTVGLEPIVGSVRPFAEVQPSAALLYGAPVIGFRARAGLNFYF